MKQVEKFLRKETFFRARSFKTLYFRRTVFYFFKTLNRISIRFALTKTFNLVIATRLLKKTTEERKIGDYACMDEACFPAKYTVYLFPFPASQFSHEFHEI